MNPDQSARPSTVTTGRDSPMEVRAMPHPIAKTITVPITGDLEPLKRQLAILRTLVSQIGFALDTAILALDEPDSWPDADVQQFDGQAGDSGVNSSQNEGTT